jgi:hypothetical protein
MTWVTVGSTVATIGTGLLSKQKAPKSIPTTPLDIKKAAQDSMDANKAIFADSAGLSEKTNTFNQTEANRLSELAMPGFSKLQATLASKIQSDFDNEGQLSPDQISQLERLAGERGITNGASGGIRGLSLVKDFGFSMMDAKNADRVRAIQGLQSLMGMSARVSPTSPMHAFVNVNHSIAAQSQNNSDAQASAQSNANAQAAASNANASMWGKAFGTVAGIGLDAWKNRAPNVPNKVSNPPPGQFDYDNYN